MATELRPYQIDAINRARAAFAEGARRVCIVSPTGSGKTRIAADIVRRATRPGRKAKVWWLTHRRELVGQAYDTLKALGLHVGCVSASGVRPWDASAPVQVASVQTLITRDHAIDATLLVLDECHHFAAVEFQKAIPEGVYIVGLTATPERGDGVGLHTIMDRLVVVSQINPLIEAGYLSTVDVICPAEKLGTRSIAQRPVDAYRQNGVGQFLCYSSTIAAATKHAQEFTDDGLRVALITGKTYSDVREKALADFQAGALDGLVNVNVLTEGTDLPRATTAIVARDIGPVSLLMQIAGRVMRKHPGKDRARLLDLHGCTHIHGHPSEDRVYSLDGTGMRRVEGADQSYCRVCGNAIMPGNACDDCGTAPKKPKPMRVTGDALVKFEGVRKQPTNQRVENLKKWIAIAQAKGWKKGQPMYRYFAAYGHWPNRAMMAAAYRR